MELSRELLFFFSALGAFNGLVLGLYFLLIAKPPAASNYFLGFLLLALCIRIGKSVIYYFNPDLAGIFLQLGMSGCLFIGPSLYFYIKSVLNPSEISSEWKYHYSILFIGITIINVLYPWDTSPEWYYFFHTIYYIWLGYILLSGWILKSTLSKLFKRSIPLSSMEIWVTSIFIGNAIIWIAYKTTAYTSYIVGALSFSFVFYLLILLLIFTRRKDASFMARQVKYASKKISEEEADKMFLQLQKLMKDEMLFQDSNIKLSDIAERLKVLPHTLSQLINDNLGKNFTVFINEYRINLAKNLIKENTHLKLEAIGYDCGFNSKSAFYSAFKKITGMTHAQFKEKESLIKS